MELKNIDTKQIYAYANHLADEAKTYTDEIEKAHQFRNEGFMPDVQYDALRADRERKSAPYAEKADLLRRFARAVDARIAMETSGDVFAEFMVANADDVDSFDLKAVENAIACAKFLSDITPC